MTDIKRSKLEWAGQMCRKPNSVVQRVLQITQGAKIHWGNLRLRWEDGIRKYFRNMPEEKIMDWKDTAHNKDE